MTSRIPFIDALKAIACLLIVSHHLAFYGPMSDTAYPLITTIIDWLYQNGRIAVQVFLVTAGFLFAAKFAPDGMVLLPQPIRIIKQRYLRLALPYAFALVAAIGCSAMVRSTLTHHGVPALPHAPQVLANLFLLQDLVKQEALSAGVWYVAIDFQLFAFGIVLLYLCGKLVRHAPILTPLTYVVIVLMTAASLFIYNRNEAWNNTALYFFGSYGLGMLAYWASNRRRGLLWLALLGLMALAALLVAFRLRIAVATLLMLLLGLARQYPRLSQRTMPVTLSYLGKISYSIFLIHYPLCLLVNAVFFTFAPHSAVINTCGMLLALGISIVGGALFFKYIESGWLIRSIRSAFKLRRDAPLTAP